MVIVLVRFGPSVILKAFTKRPQISAEMPAWLSGMGLDAYEYQCNRGVNIGKELAEKIGQEAQKYNIFLSIHAPYYINMASPERKKE